MKNINPPKVKICCISNVQEAKMAIDSGASALGLVSEMPSGPGVIPNNIIQEIAEAVPPPIATFLLTSKTDVLEIADQQRILKANTIQLVDTLTKGTHWDLKRQLPGIKIVQVVHVTGEESIEEAVKLSKSADAILLDSGNPNLKVKELGGTGRTHNWEISRIIRDAIDIPMFLAGGLNPDNVAEAIEIVQPYGIDICSGVRTNGKLDPAKLVKIFDQVNLV